jgi:hypothetical protein
MMTTPTPQPSPGRRSRRARLSTPPERLTKLRADDPKATIDEIVERYLQPIRDNSLFDDAQTELWALGAVELWLRANITPSQPARVRPTPEQRQERKARIHKQVAELKAKDTARIEAAVKIRLLDWMTTFGQPLGDCTGAQCQRLSRRYGPFFAEVAKRLNPSDHVKNHLTETELQEIARTYRLGVSDR